jgi:hypothetical protein
MEPCNLCYPWGRANSLKRQDDTFVWESLIDTDQKNAQKSGGFQCARPKRGPALRWSAALSLSKP